MKKFLLLFLAVALVISVIGCSSKTEYDKLLDEKKELVKESKRKVSEDYISERANYKATKKDNKIVPVLGTSELINVKQRMNVLRNKYGPRFEEMKLADFVRKRKI